MKSFVFAFSSRLLVSLTSCNRAPAFITRTGTFKLFHGQVTIDVFEAPESRVNYSVTQHGSGTWEPAKAPIQRSSTWFIYPVNRNSIWVYHGDEQRVVLIELDGRVFKITDNEVITDLLQRAPAEFLGRLPPRLKPQ